MKYIGPFFRMNSLSKEDISGQLFHLSKEAVTSICLNSKCGIVSSFKSSKKSHSTNDISILNDFSPLLCLYEKSSPVYVHNKTSYGFDESTFKKNINPSTNALMTLCLLELSDYYSHFNSPSGKITLPKKPYNILCKKQLDFYTNNLRNAEGVFVEKKNLSEDNYKGYNLIDKDKSFNFSDQAFMMNAYYLYSLRYHDEPISNDYMEFSTQILDMFSDFKDELYNISFDEGCTILIALNLFYSFSKFEKCRTLIIDLSDFLMDKFEEKDYYVSSIEDCSLFAIALKDSFKHTEITPFNEKSEEIFEKLEALYNSDKGIFMKLNEKKEVKYSSLEMCLYFLAMLVHSEHKEETIEARNFLSNLYKKLFIYSGIVLSWPAAPTLDEVERYRSLSLRSNDMLDESFFRMPDIPAPESSGLAPIFAKNITYSRKKDSFTLPKMTFDSNKNMFMFFLLIHYLKDGIIENMDLNENKKRDIKEEPDEETVPPIVDDDINHI